MEHENVFSTILTEVILGWYFSLARDRPFKTFQFGTGTEFCSLFFPKWAELSLDREQKSPTMQNVRTVLLKTCLPMEDIPGHLGTPRLSVLCDGKTPHRWRSARQLPLSPWSERMLPSGPAGRPGQRGIFHPQVRDQAPPATSRQTEPRPRRHWRWKREGKCTAGKASVR